MDEPFSGIVLFKYTIPSATSHNGKNANASNCRQNTENSVLLPIGYS